MAEIPRGSHLSSVGFPRLRLQQLELKQPVETMRGSPQNPETAALASDLYSPPNSNVQDKFVMCSRHCHQDPSRKHHWIETRQSLPGAFVSQSLSAWGKPPFPSTYLFMCLPNWTTVCSQSTEDHHFTEDDESSVSQSHPHEETWLLWKVIEVISQVGE